MTNDIKHIPVLLSEAIEALDVKKRGKYIDANLGGGGHTREILNRGGRVLGIDVDQYAIEKVTAEFAEEIANGQLVIFNENFINISEISTEAGWKEGEIDGILYDLGLSTFQLKVQQKGFSFEDGTFLDMRMDTRLGVTAADLIFALSEKELAGLIAKYGEDPQAKNFARAIKAGIKNIHRDDISALKLAEIIRKASKYDKGDGYLQPPTSRRRIHPATRVFQALRIAVNSELYNLRLSLNQAAALLGKNGRLVVITFHSLEDRIVKDLKKSPDLKALNAEPIVPGQEEVRKNPSSRSAKLRIYEKFNK